MNKNYTSIILLFLLGLQSFAQNPTDSVIPNPIGYTTPQLRTNGLAIDNSDNKWIAFDKIGLGKLNASGWTIYDSLNSPLPYKVLSVACNAAGVWAGTNSGLYNYNGTSWTSYKTSNSNIPTDTIPKLYSPGGNELWMFGKGGFVYFNGSTFTKYTIANSGLVNDTVQCVFKSLTGMWWIGTVHGLSSYYGSNWQNYTKSNTNLCDDNILSLIEDKNNVLFIGTKATELFIKSGNNFFSLGNYLPDYFTSHKPVCHLLSLSDGRIILCMDYNSQYFISSNPVFFDLRQGSIINSIDSLSLYVMDKSDRVWKIFKKIFSMGMTDSLTYFSSIPTASPALTPYNFLDVNEVRCEMWDDNIFHWDKIGNARYEVPKNECGKSPLFASALWIGGLDSTGKIHLAAQTYRQSGGDFWPGPLDTTNAALDSVTKSKYDFIWKVNRDTINQFIVQYNLGNVTNHSYAVPKEILNWPAHGTGNYTRNLAPFIDHNSDGIYNPYDGDYPDMKGDQMLWWVMNDHFSNIHSESHGVPMGIEIQSKAYAYSCQNISSSDEAVNYSTFYSFNIINRSDTDYHDVYIGVWLDVDLGYYNDDFIGCRIDGDYSFVYNSDNYDEGVAGYGVNPPILSAVILKGPQADLNDGLDNNHNGTIDEPGENCMMNHFMDYHKSGSLDGYPYDPRSYYNYLRSLWIDSTHLTFGGNGFHGGGLGGTLTPTDYMFSGIPYDTGWTQTSAGYTPGDRRLFMSSGPFSLKTHQSKTLDYAIVFSWDRTHANGLTTSVAKNDYDVRKIKYWFETDSFPCKHSVGINEIKNDNSGFFIYPNPAQWSFSVTIQSKGSKKLLLDLIDVTGRIIRQEMILPNYQNVISVNDIAKGIYFVRIIEAKGSFTKKLIIE